VNQEESEQNEVDGMKKGDDYTGMFFINRSTRKIVAHCRPFDAVTVAMLLRRQQRQLHCVYSP